MFFRDDNGQIIEHNENKFDNAVVENFEYFGDKPIPWTTIFLVLAILIVLGLILGYVFGRKKDNEQKFGFRFV